MVPLLRFWTLIRAFLVTALLLLWHNNEQLYHRRVVAGFAPAGQQRAGRSINGRRRSYYFATVTSPPGVSSNMEKNNDKTNDDDESSSSSAAAAVTARPLTENWWPVATLVSLDRTRPNALQVLGRKIVAYYNNVDDKKKKKKKKDSSSSSSSSSSSWVVLDDRCSHRFAPLSEGRLVVVTNNDDATTTTTTRLQCAYHGWQFDPSGHCACVPQLATSSRTASTSTGRHGGNAVRAYSVQERVGLLWVWTGDPLHLPASSSSSSSSSASSSLTALPISDLLQRHVDFYGHDNACFMRDLPYGMELLGENLLDLSHLPYSHHSVGSLKRELGMELQLKRVTVLPPPSAAEVAAAPDHLSASTQPQPHQQQQQPRPLYQVEVLNAGRQDPIFAGLPDPAGTRDQWTTYISYYSPCHVRYERRRGSAGPTASNVELFMCPLTAGKSRVFVFNVFELTLPPPPPPAPTTITTTINEPTSVFQILWRSSPKTWKSKCKKLMLHKALRPSRVAGHMLSHRIFDGDGIFLHKQGNRMDTNRLTYRDYSTPSSADLLLNAYRRYLDQAAARSSSSDPVAAASVHAAAAAGAAGGASNTVVYDDTAPRSVLLDRYFSHTVHCPTCREALRRTQRTKQQLATLQTAVTGATGAALLLCAAAAASSSIVMGAARRSVAATATISSPLLPISGAIGAISSYVIGRWQRRTERYEKQFVFEDYVHAEKD